MEYILIENNAVVEYPITATDITRRHRDTSFPAGPLAVEQAVYLGYTPVKPTAQPTYDPATERVEQGQPVRQQRRNGDGTFVADDPETPDDEAWEWVQTWNVVPLTPEEIAARIPSVVTMRQARLALLGAGLLTHVDAAIASMPGVEGEAARIEWEYAQEVRRDSPLVAGLTAALGLTDEQLNNLFDVGASL